MEEEELAAVENGGVNVGEDVEDVMSVDDGKKEDEVEPQVLVNEQGRAKFNCSADLEFRSDRY